MAVLLSSQKVSTTTSSPVGSQPMVSLAWQFPTPRLRRTQRFVLTALCVVAAAITWFWDRNFIFTLFLGSAIGVIWLRTAKPATLSQVRLTGGAVHVDNATYLMSGLKSFWIEYNPQGAKYLSLESKQWYLPYLKVPLRQQDPVRVRTLMLTVLPEKEHAMSWFDIAASRRTLPKIRK